MVEQAGAIPSGAEASLEDSRTQFVSSLGRRLESLRHALGALERAPGSSIHRDHVRRRIHAFGAAAGVLGFDSVFEAFREAEGALGRGESGNVLGSRELGLVARAVDLVPSLVLGADIPLGAGRPRLTEPDRRGWPTSVLLFSGPLLLESLKSGSDEATPLECDLTEDVDRAAEIVRLTAPDVAVIDADRPGARELVETLVHDPLLDPIRIVVVGTIERPEAAAALVALGALRVLPKPVSPDALRRAILDASRGRAVPVPRIEPIGTVTVEALADRLSQELRRGLVNAVRAQSRSHAIALGDGTDVLATVWGSVARVRDLVTERSEGTVQFESSGPEGAIPLAPWIGTDRVRATGGSERRGGEDVTLAGRRMLVVDDDPAVARFLGGLLRAAGAEAREAFDGKDALAIVRREWPEVVVSDVLMPGLDGFSLCREIKRDLALSDVPVILISWKEDLLQRVRELGAEAEGYLRKEATASTVVQRVREVLVPRARVEARIAAGGDARGRLDGLTPRLVLELVCRKERSVQVAIRDAAFLYEIEIRKGRVRSATRTSVEGRSERGERVLAAFLGVRAGRFSVRRNDSECAAEWDDPLRERLKGPLARARAAHRALCALDRVARIDLETDSLEPYLAATPGSVRTLVLKLSEGVAPSEILASGASGRLVETVLSDLVSHAAVAAIHGKGGEDLWALAEAEEEALEAEALEKERAATRGPAPQAARVQRAGRVVEEFAGFFGDSLPPPPLESGRDEAPRSSKNLAPPTSTPPEPSPFEAAVRSLAPEVVAAATERSDDAHPAAVPVPERNPAPKLPLPRKVQDDQETPALELGKAVAELANTPAEPPAQPGPKPHEPEAKEPAAASEATFQTPPPFTFDLTASATPAPVLELRKISEPAREPAEPIIPLVTQSTSRDEAAPVLLVATREQPETSRPERDTTPPRRDRLSPQSTVDSRREEASGLRKAIAPLVVVGVAAASSFALVSALRAPLPAPAPGPNSAEPVEVSGAAAGPVAEDTKGQPSAQAEPSASAAPGSPAPSPGATDQPLPEGITVGTGRGLLDVQVGAPYSILVDGVLVGNGPEKRLPLRAGPHEVRIITGRNKSVVSPVEIKEGRQTRLVIETVQ